MGQAMYRTGERPGAPLAVSTAGLTKRFGDRTVVEDVALAIPAGSVCGFVGPNGAGKTAGGDQAYVQVRTPASTL
jgi:ABC-2 type transport system ATP-binding protein